MLIQAEGEVCVCELSFVLGESQPKISRHLAVMRKAGVVEPRREGTWIHYRINPDLPAWSRDVMALTHQQIHGFNPFEGDREKLGQMKNRPERT